MGCMILASGLSCRRGRNDVDIDKRPLSAEAQARMTEMLKEVLEPAMRAQAQRNADDFVYTPPEVWMQQVMNVGARIVNRAVTIAYKEWFKATESDDSCAYCLEYEHDHRGYNLVCTCRHHCGATVCPAGNAFVCAHPAYGNTSHCAEIACENYAGKHVRGN